MGLLSLKPGNVILAIEAGGTQSESPQNQRAQGISFQFEVEDLDRVVGTLKSRNVRFSKDIEELEFGRVATIVDPDGNQFQLLEQ